MDTSNLNSRRSPGMLDARHLDIDDYWKRVRLAMLTAICVHIAFGVAGVLTGAPQLAWLQVVSIPVYAMSYALTFRDDHRVGNTLAWFDLLGHSTIAAAIVGPESGFQFQSWILLPVLFATPCRDLRSKVRLAAGLSVTYVLIDWGLHQLNPIAKIPPQGVAVLRYFNMSSFLAAVILTAVSHARSVVRAESRLRAVAGTDALSGLLNRRHMSEQLQQEMRRAADRRRPLTVLLLDIDHFKVINDEHGHARGDYVISRVGEILQQNVRQSDLAARWGGEEFMVLLPDTTLDVAMETAERIRRAIYSNVVRSSSNLVPVSVTIGVAGWRAGENLEATIHRADLAMYEGKHAGRNRVVMEPEALTPGLLAVG